MSGTRYAAATCGAAAAALPAVAYAAQPQACFWHLYWSEIIPVLEALCIAAAAAQAFARVPNRTRVIASVLFAVGIQGVVLVPCLSGEGDSARVVALAKIALASGWLVATTLVVTVVGLARGGDGLSGRLLCAAGLALAAGFLAVGATKQYLGITGTSVEMPSVLVEVDVPTMLLVALTATFVGMAVLLVQRRQARG